MIIKKQNHLEKSQENIIQRLQEYQEYTIYFEKKKMSKKNKASVLLKRLGVSQNNKTSVVRTLQYMGLGKIHELSENDIVLLDALIRAKKRIKHLIKKTTPIYMIIVNSNLTGKQKGELFDLAKKDKSFWQQDLDFYLVFG